MPIGGPSNLTKFGGFYGDSRKTGTARRVNFRGKPRNIPRTGRREAGKKPGTSIALHASEGRRRNMSHTLSAHQMVHGLARLAEHAAAIIVGLVMMIIGLALGVTMIMLPVGVVIGLIGVAVFVGGLFANIDAADHF
jgi:hypothetical protein